MRPSITELDWKPRSTGWTPHSFHERRKAREAHVRGISVDEKLKQVKSELKQAELKLAFEQAARKSVNDLLQQRINEVKQLRSDIEDQKQIMELMGSETPTIKLLILEVYQKYKPFGLSQTDLKSDRRTKFIVFCRSELFYRIKHETSHSLSAIGRHIGNKDHTTVLHAIRKYGQYQSGQCKLPGDIPHSMVLTPDYLEQEGCE